MVIRQLRSFRLEILVGLSSTFLGRVGVMQTGVVLRGLRRTCKVGNRRPDDMIKWLHTKAGWPAASRLHAGQIQVNLLTFLMLCARSANPFRTPRRTKKWTLLRERASWERMMICKACLACCFTSWCERPLWPAPQRSSAPPWTMRHHGCSSKV